MENFCNSMNTAASSAETEPNTTASVVLFVSEPLASSRSIAWESEAHARGVEKGTGRFGTGRCSASGPRKM